MNNQPDYNQPFQEVLRPSRIVPVGERGGGSGRGRNTSKAEVESNEASSDSRLRTERYEDGAGVDLEGLPELSELKLVSMEDVLAEMESNQKPTVETGKKGKRQNRGKSWQLKEVPEAYRSWKKELSELSADDPRREEVQARLDRAEAMLNAEVAKRNQKAHEARKTEAVKQRSAAHKEKALIKQYRDQGPKGIERVESQMKAYEETIAGLRSKVDAGEDVENAKARLQEMEANLDRVKNEIEKRKWAIGLNDEWMVEHDAKIGLLEGRVTEAEDALQQAKEATASAIKQVTDQYGDIVFELDPPRGPAPEALAIDMNAPSAKDSAWKKRAKNVAVVGGATVGSMGVMGFGLFKDLFKNWQSHVKKPGAMFGGWTWKDFFWRDGGKKK